MTQNVTNSNRNPLATDGPAAANVAMVDVGHVDLHAYARFAEQKLREYEREREEMINSIETARTSEKEIITLRWTLRQKEDEIMQMQQLLAKNKELFLAARHDIELLNDENATYRQRELADRKIISELLKLTQPVGDELTFIFQQHTARRQQATLPSPQLQTKLAKERAKERAALIAQAKAREAGAAPTPTATSGAFGSGDAQKATEEAWQDLLRQAELQHQRDLQVHAQEREAAGQYFKAQADEQTRTIEHLKTTLMNTTKQLCEYRHAAQIRIRELARQVMEEQQRANDQAQEFQNELAQRETEYKEALVQSQQADQDLIRRLRTVAQENDAAVHNIADEMAWVKHQAESKGKKMSARLRELRSRCERLSQFRYYALRGCESELHLLTNRIESLEKKVYFHVLKPQSGTMLWNLAERNDRARALLEMCDAGTMEALGPSACAEPPSLVTLNTTSAQNSLGPSNDEMTTTVDQQPPHSHCCSQPLLKHSRRSSRLRAAQHPPRAHSHCHHHHRQHHHLVRSHPQHHHTTARVSG